MAQENVRGWIREENLHLLGAFLTPELKALTEAVVAPMVVYETDMNLYLGTRRIQVRSLPGHTGGDSVVFIPDAKVVFAGDLVWRNMLPNLIDASTKPWIETLDSLVADSAPDSAFVPGHGELGKASDVAAFREYSGRAAHARRGGASSRPIRRCAHSSRAACVEREVRRMGVHRAARERQHSPDRC